MHSKCFSGYKSIPEDARWATSEQDSGSAGRKDASQKDLEVATGSSQVSLWMLRSVIKTYTPPPPPTVIKASIILLLGIFTFSLSRLIIGLIQRRVKESEKGTVRDRERDRESNRHTRMTIYKNTLCM